MSIERIDGAVDSGVGLNSEGPRRLDASQGKRHSIHKLAGKSVTAIRNGRCGVSKPSPEMCV